MEFIGRHGAVKGMGGEVKEKPKLWLMEFGGERERKVMGLK